LERIGDARRLEKLERWVAAAYMACRGVEVMLRALLRSETRMLKTGHDLRELLKQVGAVQLLRNRDRRELKQAASR